MWAATLGIAMNFSWCAARRGKSARSCSLSGTSRSSISTTHPMKISAWVRERVDAIQPVEDWKEENITAIYVKYWNIIKYSRAITLVINSLSHLAQRLLKVGKVLVARGHEHSAEQLSLKMNHWETSNTDYDSQLQSLHLTMTVQSTRYCVKWRVSSKYLAL